MKKEQLIQIAKVGFTERVKESINFNNVEIISKSNVHWLYSKDVDFNFMLPKKSILSIHIIPEDNFIQITPYSKAFNHYKAIKEVELLNLM